MQKLPVIPYTRAGPSVLRKDQLTPFLKTLVVQESKLDKIHNANDKPIRVVGSTKLYVHVDGMTKLAIFLICKRLAGPAILECDFCDQFVKLIYPKTRLVKLIDASTVPIVRHDEKQRLVATKNTKVVSFPKRKGRVPPKIQRVRDCPFSQTLIRVQTKQKGLILFTLKTPSGKRIKCSAARRIQNVMCDVPFRVTIANLNREKNMISKNQIVAMAEGTPKMMIARRKPQGKCWALQKSQNKIS